MAVVPLPMKFQFHEGPIKTLGHSLQTYSNRVFQFHEGPIKTHFSLEELTHTRSFNSMKVRLKLAMTGEEYVMSEFQFHEGPIKTHGPQCCLGRKPVSIP